VLTSLLTALGLVFVLALWHGTLVRFGGEPSWARLVVRVCLAVVTCIQAIAFVVVQGLTREVQLDQVNHVLNQVQQWTDLADGSSLALIVGCALLLLVFTVRRVLRGPIGADPDPD